MDAKFFTGRAAILFSKATLSSTGTLRSTERRRTPSTARRRTSSNESRRSPSTARCRTPGTARLVYRARTRPHTQHSTAQGAAHPGCRTPQGAAHSAHHAATYPAHSSHGSKQKEFEGRA